jgi:beta-lactamase regulating signal transducer with metallopeptidase domain
MDNKVEGKTENQESIITTTPIQAATTSSTPTTSSPSPFEAIQQLKTENKEEIDKINQFVIGILIFIVITFTVQMWVSSLDRIKDKDLYLRYNDMFQKYFDESSKQKDEINSQKIEINNLKNQLELFRIKNLLN